MLQVWHLLISVGIKLGFFSLCLNFDFNARRLALRGARLALLHRALEVPALMRVGVGLSMNVNELVIRVN